MFNYEHNFKQISQIYDDINSSETEKKIKTITNWQPQMERIKIEV
jgi:hypothetical protein